MSRYNENLIEKCRNVDWKKTMVTKGYAYFNRGYYNLNIIGVRSVKNGNEFNDAIVIKYIGKNNKEYTVVFPCTTDPGYKSLINPVNIKGCAILVPNQYRNSWKVGYHKGQYKALVQHKPVEVYRDCNKDYFLDLNEDTIEKGMYGINIHKAGEDSIVVDGWSAGCTVFARKTDFIEFMNVVTLAIPVWGDVFTYTLLKEEDLIL